MHRVTPLNAAYIAYTGGGARATVDKVSDDPMMQEMSGNFMKGETRSKIESPQNYGFTSVVMPATKGKDGQIEESAEAFISFMGGNRSFPVATVMDDRRYRLKELKPGDTAIYDHQQQQLHFNKDGAYLTGNTGKKIRMQLADVDQKSGQGASAQPTVGPTQQAASGGGGGQAASSQGGVKDGGQKARYEKQSKQYHEIGKDQTDQMNKKHRITLDDEDTMIIIKKDGEPGVYLGGDPDKGHKFAKVVTTAGPSKNVYARIP